MQGLWSGVFLQPGEGGIILPDAGVEESSTDIEDPPSPCDVIFEGDNVLINGKSNLKKSPKQVKVSELSYVKPWLQSFTSNLIWKSIGTKTTHWGRPMTGFVTAELF